LRTKEKDCTQPIFYPGLAGKYGSGLGKTLDTNEQIIADDGPYTKKLDHELNYSKSSSDDLDQCVSSSEELDSEASVGEDGSEQDVASAFDRIHEDFSEIQEEFSQLFG
jgi:hypothetical protein